MRKPGLSFAADGMHRTDAGKTEIAVTIFYGTTAIFKITCQVTQIGKE